MCSNMDASEVIQVRKTTLDALVFFCFGFTLDEDFDTLLDLIIAKAYRDATSQGAFNTKADSDKAQMAKTGEKGSVALMNTWIKDLLNADGVIVFDDWHKELCKELIKIYEDNDLGDVFTYGNAQKWVNMTLKYIYIICGIDAGYSQNFYEKACGVMKYANALHFPVDSYIIDVLWSKKDVEIPLKYGVDEDKREKNSYKIPSEYVVGWSNWGEAEYEDLMGEKDAICGSRLPIDWETEVWIKRAKERNR